LGNIPRMLRGIILLASTSLLAGCIYVKLAPVEAHVTVDVNVKVDKALNDFFGDLDQKSASLSTAPAKP
jgi:hypothetical protein